MAAHTDKIPTTSEQHWNSRTIRFALRIVLFIANRTRFFCQCGNAVVRSVHCVQLLQNLIAHIHEVGSQHVLCVHNQLVYDSLLLSLCNYLLSRADERVVFPKLRDAVLQTPLPGRCLQRDVHLGPEGCRCVLQIRCEVGRAAFFVQLLTRRDCIAYVLACLGPHEQSICVDRKRDQSYHLSEYKLVYSCYGR